MKYEVRIVQENKYGGTDDINGELDSFEDVQVLINLVMKAFPKTEISATVTVASNDFGEEDK